MKYGISSFDVEFQQKKMENQKEFLIGQNFVTSSGTIKSLMDVSMSANLSSRYYAQLVNKVNTLQQVMSNENLTPVFLTMTLHGWMHDLYYGDYSRFTDDCLSKLPENDKYGLLKTKAGNRETFDVHDLYMVLRWNWERLSGSAIFRSVRETSKLGYLFAVEPHESGVPHAHVLLYLPSWAIDKAKKSFMHYFDAPMNVSQDFNRLSPSQVLNGEINGFQWTISNPVGYILKYVTKSFMNIKNEEKLDELQAWYIKHRIVRFTTSHTLVPQWVYQKMYPLESDWLYLSQLKTNGSFEWSHEDDYFKCEDKNMDKTLIYTRGLYQMFINGTLEREFGILKEQREVNTMYHQPHRVVSSLVPRPLRFSVSFEGNFNYTHKGDIANYLSSNLQSYLRKFMRNKLELDFYDVSLTSITFTHFLPKQDLRNSKKEVYKSKNNDTLSIYIIDKDGFKFKLKSATTFNSRTDLDLLAHFSCVNPVNPNYKFFPLVHDNFVYYTLLRNECIKRGLIQGSIQSCNTIFEEENPYKDEFTKSRTYFSSMEAVNSLISLQNIISKIGA